MAIHIAIGIAGGDVLVVASGFKSAEVVGRHKGPCPGFYGPVDQVLTVRLQSWIGQRFVHLSSTGKNGRSGDGCGSTFPHPIAGPGIQARQCGYFVKIVHAYFDHESIGACCVLHAFEPVEFPFDFVQKVGNVVARFGDVVIVFEHRGVEAVSLQHVQQGIESEGGILVGVSCIPPTATHITGGGRVAFVVTATGGFVLIGAAITSRIGPFRIDVGRIFGKIDPLVKKHAHGLTQHLVVDFVANVKTKRTDLIGHIKDVIGTRSRHRTEIEPPAAVAGLAVGVAVVPDLQGSTKHHLIVIPAADLVLVVAHPWCKSLAGIEAHLRIGNDRNFFGLTEVAELVYFDELGGGFWASQELKCTAHQKEQEVVAMTYGFHEMKF